jgi:hypothetical protein
MVTALVVIGKEVMGAGDEVWQQDEVMSDSHIFDLEAAEAQIATFLETGVQ